MAVGENSPSPYYIAYPRVTIYHCLGLPPSFSPLPAISGCRCILYTAQPISVNTL